MRSVSEMEPMRSVSEMKSSVQESVLIIPVLGIWCYTPLVLALEEMEDGFESSRSALSIQ